MPITAKDLYDDLWVNDASLLEEAGRSLGPRGSDVLYEHFAAFNVGPDDAVLDAGCGFGNHAITLAKRFRCRVVAVDPMDVHLAAVRQKVAEHGLRDRVSVYAGTIERLPLDDAAVDHVWCRDMLNHVDLVPALRECRRVLRPGGGMLVYQTFATPSLEPREAARLFRALAIFEPNMEPAYFETAARQAGFVIDAHDPVDSEWRERWIEEGDHEIAQELLTLARMRRNEANLVAKYGRDQYEAVYAGNLWGAYQLLGKLRPTIYRLRLPLA